MTSFRVAFGFVCLASFTVFANADDPQTIKTKLIQVEPKLSQQLLGEWVLSGEPNAEIEPAPGARMKFIGRRHWFITERDPATGVVIFHHGGTYELDGDGYAETLTFANESTKHMIGITYKFKIKVEEGKYIQIGDGNPFNEVWTRPKK